VLAIHVPVAAAALVPVVMGWPLILMPVHVIFMEMIVDPACSIAFELEPAEADVMRRPPRQPGARLFDRPMVVRSLLQGTGVAVVTVAVFGAALYTGYDEFDARTLGFATLITSNLALILANRSLGLSMLTTWRRPNPALGWLVASAIGILGLVMYVPALRTMFHLATPHPPDLLLCAVGAALAAGWLEVVRLVGSRRVAQ
jgi:Ca2+-transporting ATPase